MSLFSKSNFFSIYYSYCFLVFGLLICICFLWTEPQEKITTKMLLLPFVQELSPISIPNVYNVNHIAHVTSEKIWLSDRKHVMKIDHSGHSLQSFRIDDIWGSASHTAEKDGNILYIKNDHQVIRATKDGNEQTLLTLEWTILSIYASQLNGDILLGIYILIEKGSQTCKIL